MSIRELGDWRTRLLLAGFYQDTSRGLRLWITLGAISDNNSFTTTDRIRFQQEDPPHDALRPQGFPRQQRP